MTIARIAPLAILASFVLALPRCRPKLAEQYPRGPGQFPAANAPAPAAAGPGQFPPANAPTALPAQPGAGSAAVAMGQRRPPQHPAWGGGGAPMARRAALR